MDVWSDVVCPWCYLGEGRLSRAIDELRWGDDVEVAWRPFQLDPSAPAEPQDLRRALERKYGPGAFDVMTRRLTTLGRSEGIDFRFDLARRVNTMDAQRLLVWTGQRSLSLQMALARRFFRAYFTEGLDVADRATLATLAAELDIPHDEALSVLMGDALTEQVESEREVALDRAIAGVPTFVIADRWQIPGAQDVGTMISVLERARSTLD